MNILILDDSAAARLDITMALKDFDPSVNILEAANVEEAVTLIRDHAIDVAFVDLCMPDRINGADFIVDCLKANKDTREIPVIVVSRVSERSVIKRAIEGLAYKFISKPVDPSELKTILKTLFNTKLNGVLT